jgi:hypothetical protein
MQMCSSRVTCITHRTDNFPLRDALATGHICYTHVSVCWLPPIPMIDDHQIPCNQLAPTYENNNALSVE